MVKGTFSWFEKLKDEHQLQVFKRWRMVTTDVRKHWCLDEIRQDKKLVMYMLKEVSIDITGKKCLSKFNDLDIGWYTNYHF